MLQLATRFLTKFLVKRLVMSASRRVEKHTSEEINQKIRNETVRNLKYYSSHPDGIGTRLHELDEEWDTERTMATYTSVVAAVTTVLGFKVNKKWFYVAGLATSIQLQHAIQGWNPFLPLIRMSRVRTRHEIDEEKFALKALRGDFKRSLHQKDTEKNAYKAYTAVAS